MRLILKMPVPLPLPPGARLRALPASAAALSELSPCTTSVVLGVTGDGILRRRLMEFGLVSGTEVRVVRVAPLGDPIQVELRGYHLSLRRAEAKRVRVEQR